MVNVPIIRMVYIEGGMTIPKMRSRSTLAHMICHPNLQVPRRLHFPKSKLILEGTHLKKLEDDS